MPGPGLWLPVAIPVVWRTPDSLILQVSTSHLLICGAADQSPPGLDFCRSLWEMPDSPGLGSKQTTQILLPWARALTLFQNVLIPSLIPSRFPSPETGLPKAIRQGNWEQIKLAPSPHHSSSLSFVKKLTGWEIVGLSPSTRGLSIPGDACSLCSSPRPGGSSAGKKVFRVRRPGINEGCSLAQPGRAPFTVSWSEVSSS